MYQRLVRAKRKIVAGRHPVPGPSADELPERLAGVRHVVYLVFNEGHTATGGDELVHDGLCDEAIRLARLLTELIPDDAETLGLLALLLLTDARRAGPDRRRRRPGLARGPGPLPLGPRPVAEGVAALERALSLGDPAVPGAGGDGRAARRGAVVRRHGLAPGRRALRSSWSGMTRRRSSGCTGRPPSASRAPPPGWRCWRPSTTTAWPGTSPTGRCGRSSWPAPVRPRRTAREAYRRALALTANDRQRAALAARAARLTGEEPAQPEP